MRANFVLSGVATGLRRNLSMTIALVLSTAIALSFVGSAVVANFFIGHFQDQYENKLSVTIYLCPSQQVENDTKCTARYTDAEAATLKTKLSADSRVESYTFYDEQQSYQRALKALPPATAANLEVGVIPALFQLKLKNIQRDYDGVRNTYENLPGVQDVQNQSEDLRTLLQLFSQVRLASAIVALIVLISAVILMANTIQVAAQHRRNETAIMRLVGASRWVTQLPFIIEAVIAALVGGLIAMGFVFAGRYFFFNRVFKTQIANHVLPGVSDNDVLIAGGVGLAAGIVLAAITAYTTLRVAVKI